MTHVGILQTGHAPQVHLDVLGDYDAQFHRLLDGQALRFTTWNVVDGAFPDGAEAADAWLITGSRHGAYEDHAWIPPLEALIRDIAAARRPLVGICFGHQIVAQALGGRVERFAGGWMVGRQVYDFDGDAVALNAWHQDQVVEAPEGARAIATNAWCENAALLYDGILTVQAHPEFTAPAVEGLIDTRGPGVVPDEKLAAARQALSMPVATQRLADALATFLRTGTYDGV
ncbi:MAG: type 1 glutamine amidotransferase [Paracoccaceae bacterium]